MPLKGSGFAMKYSWQSNHNLSYLDFACNFVIRTCEKVPKILHTLPLRRFYNRVNIVPALADAHSPCWKRDADARPIGAWIRRAHVSCDGSRWNRCGTNHPTFADFCSQILFQGSNPRFMGYHLLEVGARALQPRHPMSLRFRARFKGPCQCPSACVRREIYARRKRWEKAYRALGQGAAGVEICVGLPSCWACWPWCWPS